jgi:hypothetical protein
MWRFDWHYTPHVSSCTEARRLQTYVKEAIAPHLSDGTTQEEFDAVMAALKRYKDDLLKHKKTFHFPAGHGRHYCVEEAFQYIDSILRVRWSLRPKPTPLPEPRSPLETPEQVVAELDELIQHRTDETVLGEDTEQTQ